MNRFFVSGALFAMGLFALSTSTVQAQTSPSGQTSNQSQQSDQAYPGGQSSTQSDQTPTQSQEPSQAYPGDQTSTQGQQSGQSTTGYPDQTQQPTGGMDRSQQSTGSVDQTQPSTTTDQTSGKRRRDRDQMSGTANRATSSESSFLTKAAEGDLAEIELGNLAQQKATNQATKDFAQKMVTDHTKSLDQLKEVAQKQNVTLPTTPSAKDQAEKRRLENLSGDAFDRAYMSRMVSDHQKDLKEYQKQAQNGKDADVKSFASQTVPTLQEHLQMARQTESQLRGTKGSSTTSGSASRSSDQHDNMNTTQPSDQNRQDNTSQYPKK